MSELNRKQTATNGHTNHVEFGAGASKGEPLKPNLQTPLAKDVTGHATVNELDKWSEAFAKSDPYVSQLLEDGDRLIDSVARRKAGLEAKVEERTAELAATPRRIDVPVAVDSYGLPKPVLKSVRGLMVSLGVLLATSWMAVTLGMEYGFDLGMAMESAFAIFQNLDSAGGLVFALSFGAFGCFSYWMTAHIHQWHWTHIAVANWAARISVALLIVGTVGLGISHREEGLGGWLIVLMLPLGAFVLVGSAMAGKAMFGWVGKLIFPTREKDNKLHSKREGSLAKEWDDLDDVNETTGKGQRLKERAYDIIKDFQGRCRSRWETCGHAKALADKFRETQLQVGIAQLHEQAAKKAFEELTFEVPQS